MEYVSFLLGAIIVLNIITLWRLPRENKDIMQKHYEDMRQLTNQFVNLSTQLFNYKENKGLNVPQVADIKEDFSDDPTPPSDQAGLDQDEVVFSAGQL